MATSEVDTKELVEEEEKGSVWLQYASGFSATLSFTFGGTLHGWSSVSVPGLQDANSHIPLTSTEASWLVSIMTIGCVLTTIPTGYLLDRVGRKPTLLILGFPAVVSWLMLYFGTSFAELLIARLISGMAFGMAFAVLPVYLGEIPEDRIRGSIASIFQFMLNIGILFEYCVGPYVPYKTLCLLSIIFPVLLMSTMIWMPESPYYLIAKSRLDDAEKVLMRLRGKKKPESVKKEMDMIRMSVEIQASKKGSFRDLFGSRGNLKALSILMMLLLIQNFCGIVAMLSYVTSINSRSGSSLDPDVAVIIFGCVQLVVSGFSSGVVDRTGRRPLLLLSTIGCALTLTCEGLYFFLSENGYETAIPIDWMPLLFLSLYIIVFNLGLGPIPLAVGGEIFARNVKGLAIGVGSSFTNVAAFVATQLFHIISENYGVHTIFWVFAVCCVFGAVYIAIFVPETKGKSLLQINIEISGDRPKQTEKDEVENTKE